jgi:hypothetical protein
MVIFPPFLTYVTETMKLNDLDYVVSSKVVSVSVMKACKGNRRVVPLILSLGIKRSLVINITLHCLCP